MSTVSSPAGSIISITSVSAEGFTGFVSDIVGPVYTLVQQQRSQSNLPTESLNKGSPALTFLPEHTHIGLAAFQYSGSNGNGTDVLHFDLFFQFILFDKSKLFV